MENLLSGYSVDHASQSSEYSKGLVVTFPLLLRSNFA